MNIKNQQQQEFNGFHEEISELPNFQAEFSDFSDLNHGDMSKNPFLASSPEPVSKKIPSSPVKIFQKPAEIILASKSTRYDVFKNENSNFINEEQDDPFKDFAKAAFSEFRIDKMMGHEFSNKLLSNKGFQVAPSGGLKVNHLFVFVAYFHQASCIV